MKKAFTLIELLVVVGIISILTVISIAGFSAQQKKARDSRRIADVGSLGLAIENYRTLNNSYPNQVGTEQDGTLITSNLNVLVDNGLINTLPSEPKPIPGSEKFCTNYTYAKDWSYTGDGDTALGKYIEPVGNTGLPKKRAYVIYSRMEDVGTSAGLNKQDSSFYTTPSATWCSDGSSAYGFLLGPKT